MKISTQSIDIVNDDSQLLVIPVFKNNELSDSGKNLDNASNNSLKSFFELGEFSGKDGESHLLFNLPGIKAKRLLLLGVEDPSLTQKRLGKVLDGLSTTLKKVKVSEVTIDFSNLSIDSEENINLALQTGLFLGNLTYQFQEFKTDKKDPITLNSAIIDFGESKNNDASESVRRGLAISVGVQFTKDLGNTPANFCTPSNLGSEAEKLAVTYEKIQSEVKSEDWLEEKGFGAMLSVAAGTLEPAKFIIMEYKGASTENQPIILVGKGVTFDSGGISIKPSQAMDEMKYDMCGAATVFGVFKAVAEMDLAINIVGLVPATENMPSGKATKPGDIVTSLDGKTIEVLNTDAEGRLILCDALTYAKEYNPAAIIDIATLTGACIIALGHHATGLYSNQEIFAEELLAAGKSIGDKAWHMPLWDEFQKQIESPFADIANVGGRDGGSVTAACFLSRFVDPKTPWIHLDIAGTAWKSGASKGATGRPVALLSEFLMRRATD